MAKHSKEKNTNYIIGIIIVIILILCVLTLCTYRNLEVIKEIVSSKKSKPDVTNATAIINDTTIENERLVIKSVSEYNKIIEYNFDNDILKSVLIYEQFEDKEKFENKKQSYEKKDNIIIKNIEENNLIIEIEKQDFGTDTDLSYNEIYDKYLVQIIGAYERI